MLAHRLYGFYESVDGDREEDPCIPISAPAKTDIHFDPPAGFEKLQDGGDLGPVAKSLGEDIAKAGRQYDHRKFVPYRGRGEIVERVVAANADQVVGRHAAGVCPAERMGPVFSDERRGAISSRFERVQERLDKGDRLTPAGAWIDHQLDIG